MAIVEMEWDTACVNRAHFDFCIADGKILAATAILNRRWEDFSAADFVAGIGLRKVQWNVVEDDTPGTLRLTVGYPVTPIAVLEQRFVGREGLWSYAFRNHLYV